MGYAELLEILRDQVREAERAEREPPRSCPEDGVPLDLTERGRHCRFCGRVFE